MKIIQDQGEMKRYADTLRLQGKQIAFVPTMGYLHEGHLSLVREGKKRADCVVVSIFVNPTQFGPSEDLDAYPRDFARDEALLKEIGTDVIFYPTKEAMYPERYQTYVTVEKVSQNLCGVSRPTHFRGVATIVTKLFNIVKPHVALFGQKDFQQLVVIQRMVEDLNFDIEIVGSPTVREQDGLAMSSRNTYLSPEERTSALLIKKALDRTRDLYLEGVTKAQVLIKEAKEVLSESPRIKIDYVKICNARTLEDVEEIQDEAVMAVAVFIGKTRLIDNYVFRGPA
jgi:pantoate--beta-alanine ligase